MNETLNSIVAFFTGGGPIFTALAVILVLIIGRIIAKFIAKMLAKALKGAKLDEKLALDGFSLSDFLSKLVYYLLMIIVLMVALEILGVKQVLDPLKEMTQKVFSYIPNIIVAGLIAYIGYFLAKVVSEAVTLIGDSLLKLVPKLGLSKDINIVAIAKKVVFVLVFVPILIIAVNALDIDIITNPTTVMLNKFFLAVPNILAAFIIVFIGVVVGKLVSGLLKGLLDALNLNKLTECVGLDKLVGQTNLPLLISNVVFFLIVYFSSIEAFNQLEFTSMVAILNNLLVVFGKIAFGLLILLIGNVVANFASKIYNNGEKPNKFVGAILKGAILVIFLTMGLYSMGIAESIVQLAFGLALGALAVAFALSFGLGGREAAGQEMKEFFKKLKDKND